jgi:HEAT repeat protein
MKKWIALGVFVILYAWAMFLFFRHFHKNNVRHPAPATSAPPSSVFKGMPPRLNPPPIPEKPKVVVHHIGDGTFEDVLPYAAVTETLLAYVGLDKAESHNRPLVEVTTKERYVASPDHPLLPPKPEIKGTISLSPPGKEPTSIKFDSNITMLESNTNADDNAPIPSMEEVFNNTFPPKMAEIAGRFAGPTTLVPALGNTDPVIRQAAEKALMSIAGSSAIDIKLAEMLADLMESKDSATRDVAVRILGAMTDPRIVPLLVAILSDESAEVRASALEALGKVKDLRAVNPVMNSADDPNAAVRLQAVRTLGNMGSTQAVEVLITVLKDENPEVRQASIEALAKIHAPGLCDRLLVLTPGADVTLQKLLVKALGDTQDPKAVPYLSTALKNPQAEVRDSATEALGKVKDPQAIEALAQALKDEDVFVRSGAVSALEKIADRRAISPLIEALQDEGIVQMSVAMALNRLTGQNHGTDQTAWQDWWARAQRVPAPSLPFEREVSKVDLPLPKPEKEPVEEYTGPVTWPSLRLAGVLQGTSRRRGAAVLNSRIIREGDVLDGVTLQEVGEDFVKLRYHRQTRILRVNEELGE